MSSTRWLCLGLLLLAIASTHARPYPAGPQEIRDESRSQDRVAVDGPFRRAFKHHSLLSALSKRDLLDALKSRVQRSASQGPSLQPENNPHRPNICHIPKMFYNVHIYSKCISKISKKPTSPPTEFGSFYPTVFPASSNVNDIIRQPAAPAQPRLTDTSTDNLVLPVSTQDSQEGVWKFKNELNFKEDLTDEGFRKIRKSDTFETGNVGTFKSSFSRKRSNDKTQAAIIDDIETSPGSYASVILELLPIIREGYKNNAFSEDDKSVIRRVFGDMKITMNEKDRTSNLTPFDDVRLDDQSATEDTYYESKEDYEDVSTKADVRPKRAQEDYHILKRVIHTIPSQLEIKLTVTSDTNTLRKSRSSGSPPGPEAAAVLALLAENDSHVVLEPDDGTDEDDEYDEYYEYEDDEEDSDEDSEEGFDDDYENGSIKELIMLAKKHKQRKAKEEGH